MLQIFTIIVILFFSLGLPAIKKASARKTKAGRNVHRYARMYGSITLDGKSISDRQKGVIDPSAMYSETNKAEQQ